MKYIAFLLFLALTPGLVFAQENAADEASSILNQLVENKFVVGGSAGIMIGGDIVWQHASGYANLEEKELFQVTTINRTASIAKPMTAVAVLQLVERGLIDLDASIQTYIPEFPLKNSEKEMK